VDCCVLVDCRALEDCCALVSCRARLSMLARLVGCEARGSLEVFGDEAMGQQKFLGLLRSSRRILPEVHSIDF
jgi:hypothetical protein